MLKVGDTIKCHDANELIDVMTSLAKENISTEFLYEKDDQKGFWLLVKKVPKNENRVN